MKESEARGLILKRLYDARDTTRSVSFSTFADLKINRITLVNRFTLAKLLQQLADQDFISWNYIRTRTGDVDGVAHIKAKGVHAVEYPETADSSIVFERSVSARDLRDMQVGDFNVQGVTIDNQIDEPQKEHLPRTAKPSPAEFAALGGDIEGDRVHTLLRALFGLRKHAPLIEKLVVAFERSNREATSARRREVFYGLLAEILSDLER